MYCQERQYYCQDIKQQFIYYKKQNIASLSLAQVKQCLFYVLSIQPSIFLTACLTQGLERAGAFPAGGVHSEQVSSFICLISEKLQF